MKHWKIGRTAIALILLVAAVASGASPKQLPAVDARIVAKIDAAVKNVPRPKAAIQRRVLVFWRCEGFYHRSIPVANKALEILGKTTGTFKVVTSDDMGIFTNEKLAAYDAIVFNNTTNLKFKTPAARKALMDFVRGGKGVVGIHAATDNFYDFQEAAAMMGGLFAGHPWNANGTWAVKVDDPKHPLNASFGGKGFRIRDEIYQLRGPYSRRTHRVLLSLDFADKATAAPRRQRRADNDYAISVIRTWGKGRSFYTGLGHNAEVFWNAPVLAHLLAGIRFAVGDLPADATPVPLKGLDLWTEATAYEQSASRAALVMLEAEIRKTAPADHPAVEKKLLAVLKHPQAQPDAKRWACGQLRLVGSSASTPLLLKLAADDRLSHAAVQVLQTSTDPKVDDGLLGVLAAAKGHSRVTVIGALGARRTAAAVDPLAKLAADKDTATAVAAIKALGHIGTPSAHRALDAAGLDAAMADIRSRAMIDCAYHLTDTGGPAAREASAIFAALSAKIHPTAIRIAAIRGLAVGAGEQAVDELAMAAKDTDPAVAAAAVAALGNIPGAKATEALVASLEKLPIPLKVAALAQLAGRAKPGDPINVTAQLTADHPSVRHAALAVLGKTGNASHAPSLLKLASTPGPDAAPATATLVAISDPAVNTVLLKALPKADVASARVIVSVLDQRAAGHEAAGPMLAVLATTKDATVRRTAWQILTKVGDSGDLPAAIKLLLADPSSATAQRGAAAVAQRHTDATRRTKIIASAAKTADESGTVALVKVLRQLRDDLALKELTRLAGHEAPAVRRDIAASLGGWPNEKPLADLKRLAQADDDATTRTLATRSVIQLTGRIKTVETRVPHLAALLKAPKVSANDKQHVLAALGASPCTEALKAVEAYAADKTLGPAAKAAAEKIRKAMEKK